MDPTIERIISGEFQEVHAFLIDERGRQLSATYVVGIKMIRREGEGIETCVGFDIDRKVDIVAERNGLSGGVRFETADGNLVLFWPLNEFDGPVCGPMVGSTYSIAPTAS